MEAADELELVFDAIGLVVLLDCVLFSHFDELGEHVVSFSAVFWQLVAGIALEDISACEKKFFDDF